MLRELAGDSAPIGTLTPVRPSRASAISRHRASTERLGTAPDAEVKKSRLRLPASGVPLMPESMTSAESPRAARSRSV